MKDKLEEIKKEFEKTFQTEVGTKGSRRVWGTATDVWNFFEPLIQESNREAVEKFRSFCEGEVYEKRLSDEHYVLVSILIDAYLSSIGKEDKNE